MVCSSGAIRVDCQISNPVGCFICSGLRVLAYWFWVRMSSCWRSCSRNLKSWLSTVCTLSASYIRSKWSVRISIVSGSLTGGVMILSMMSTLSMKYSDRVIDPSHLYFSTSNFCLSSLCTSQLQYFCSNTLGNSLQSLAQLLVNYHHLLARPLKLLSPQCRVEAPHRDGLCVLVPSRAIPFE